jgi:CheY-like chemotaxis protein
MPFIHERVVWLLKRKNVFTYGTVQRYFCWYQSLWRGRATPEGKPEMSFRAEPLYGVEGREESCVLDARSTDAESKIVLVVEDDVWLRDDIAQHLHAKGCVVLEAETGERAIAMCRRGTPVDVLFTDIDLNGDATGWDVADVYRAARPGIAVVYTSGNGVDRSRCVAGSRFFHKPYCMADILKACGL